MNLRLCCLYLTGLVGGTVPVSAGDGYATSSQAVNALGLDLLAKGADAGGNALWSPYSIQSALAMTYAGAAGETRAEMGRVLHFPADSADLGRSFAALRKALDQVTRHTAEQAKRAKEYGGPGEPVLLTVANRLFGQQGYAYREAFLAEMRDSHNSPFQAMDFINHANEERVKINHWVGGQTRQRICDLIPAGGLTGDSRLVLVNAIYLKAPWAEEFSAGATKPWPFRVHGGKPVNVPTMYRRGRAGWAKHDGYQSITVPYFGDDLQLLVLLPDAPDGLAAMEARLTPALLGGCAKAEEREVALYLPKFKLKPPLLKLGKVLRQLGMASAFNEPRGSANFDGIAPRKPGDYLYISEIFHQTFFALDEHGTEAAAATAVAMADAAGMPAKPVEVRVDRPFWFAIQHRPSGMCLFLGRVTDPR